MRARGTSNQETQPIEVRESLNGSAVLLDTSLTESPVSASRGLIASSNEFIDISWGSPAEPSSFEVYRDGKLIAETATTAYRDVDVRPNTEYSYRVSASGLKEEEDWSEKDSQSVMQGGPKPRTGFVWSFEGHTPGDKSEAAAEELRSSLTAAAIKLPATELRWTAFIPQNGVEAPSGVCKYGSGYYYQGDNRGFVTPDYVTEQTNTASYRLRHKTQIGWGNPQPLVTGSINVGTTFAVRKSDGAVVETRTAVPTTDTRVLSSTTNFAEVRTAFSGTDPFCSTTKIAVVYRAGISRTGQWSISGSYRRMPNHEAYIYNYWGDPFGNNGPIASKVTTIVRDSIQDPLCLVGTFCEEKVISGGGSFESNN